MTKKIICVLLSVFSVVLLSFCGCDINSIVSGAFTYQDESQKLTAVTAKDYTSYEYDNKVAVILSDSYEDKLELAATKDKDW